MSEKSQELDDLLFKTIGHRSTKHVSHIEARCPIKHDSLKVGRMMTQEIRSFYDEHEFQNWMYERVEKMSFEKEIQSYSDLIREVSFPDHVDPSVDNNFLVDISKTSEQTKKEIREFYPAKSVPMIVLEAIEEIEQVYNQPVYLAAKTTITLLEKAYPWMQDTFSNFVDNGIDVLEATRRSFSEFRKNLKQLPVLSAVPELDDKLNIPLHISEDDMRGLAMISRLQERPFNHDTLVFSRKLIQENLALRTAFIIYHKLLVDFAHYQLSNSDEQVATLIPFEEIFIIQNGVIIPNVRLIKILSNNWLPAISQALLDQGISDSKMLEGRHIEMAIHNIKKYYKQFHLAIFMFNKDEITSDILYGGNIQKVCPATSMISYTGSSVLPSLYDTIRNSEHMHKKEYGDRAGILKKINVYRGSDILEKAMKSELIHFIENNPDCFKRELLIGHVNGSAWIVDSSFKFVLLSHHTKLDKWLQLGGHSDGNPNTLEVAYREAREESGLESIRPYSEDIFDIDVHSIPKRSDEPEHLHYDIRFIFTADKDDQLLISSESKDLQWVEIDKIQHLNNSVAMGRMIQKTRNLTNADR